MQRSRTRISKGRLGLSLLPFLALLILLSATAAGGSETEPPGLAKAKTAQERHTGALLSQDGVVGVGLTANDAGRGAVAVLVESNAVRGIPATLDGVPVVTIVTGEIRAFHHRNGHNGGPGGGGEEDPPQDEPPTDPTGRFPRPVPIGVSTGHPSITAGTIGARVTDGTNVYALSNNHVYADENSANTGDAVIQPGTFDGGSSPADDIGTLADFAPIVFSTSANNEIDAAIALVPAADLSNATPSDGYGTPQSATVSAAINMKVKKYGRTTGQTKGQISAINATVDVGYDSGVARFVNQIIITPGSFSAGGDSGSLIVVDGKGRDKAHDRKAVGLLFAGSSLVTVANPIDAVLSEFGVTIDGE